MWHLKQPLGKINSEKILRFFCEHRNDLLEISPRAMTQVISAFHVARDDIKQRDSLAELVGLDPPRELEAIVVPTLDGHTWINVPDVDGSPPTPPPTDKDPAKIPAQEKRQSKDPESEAPKTKSKARTEEQPEQDPEPTINRSRFNSGFDFDAFFAAHPELAKMPPERKFWLRLMNMELRTLSDSPEEVSTARDMVTKALEERGLTRKDWPPEFRRHLKYMGCLETE